MLSKKAKYALKALLMLSRERRQARAHLRYRLREEIPKKFLELILLQLKKNGLLQSKKGKGGGYCLIRRPEVISFGQVIRIIDGPLALLPA